MQNYFFGMPVMEQIAKENVFNLLARVRTVTFKTGDVVVKQGTACTKVYFIRSGKFRVVKELKRKGLIIKK